MLPVWQRKFIDSFKTSIMSNDVVKIFMISTPHTHKHTHEPAAPTRFRTTSSRCPSESTCPFIWHRKILKTLVLSFLFARVHVCVCVRPWIRASVDPDVTDVGGMCAGGTGGEGFSANNSWYMFGDNDHKQWNRVFSSYQQV